MNSVILSSLIYHRFTPSGCKDVGIIIFDFVTKTQFLYVAVLANKVIIRLFYFSIINLTEDIKILGYFVHFKLFNNPFKIFSVNLGCFLWNLGESWDVKIKSSFIYSDHGGWKISCFKFKNFLDTFIFWAGWHFY